MKNTKRKPRKNCIVCKNKIYRSNRRGQLKERRHNFALTCSRKCARVYGRIKNHVWSKITALKKRIKELENEKKKTNR